MVAAKREVVAARGGKKMWLSQIHAGPCGVAGGAMGGRVPGGCGVLDISTASTSLGRVTEEAPKVSARICGMCVYERQGVGGG